jgi:NAD(P)-dependent dehydrogenase (short-subunit alcohol dehydrogenase family)
MADMANLSVLITGAAGGIGHSLAEVFAASGARLALVDIEDTQSLAEELGPEHRAYQLDLSDPDDIMKTVPRVGTELGIDVLINNAGLGIVFPAEQMDVEDWDRTFAINLKAPWLVAAAAFPFLKRSKRGRVINMASQAGVIGLEEHSAYGASKAGLIGLTKVQAIEWARFGITVNAISPTVVETPMALVGWSGEKGEKAKRDIPVGRFAKPREIAHAALYLASKEAAMISGTNLLVDGGYCAK